MVLARRCCLIFFYPINKAVRHPRDGPLKACNLERRLVHHCAGADKHAISAGIDCQSPFCHFKRVPDCTAVLRALIKRSSTSCIRSTLPCSTVGKSSCATYFRAGGVVLSVVGSPPPKTPLPTNSFFQYSGNTRASRGMPRLDDLILDLIAESAPAPSASSEAAASAPEPDDRDAALNVICQKEFLPK